MNSHSIQQRMLAITAVGCLICWTTVDSVLANPTGQQPNRALAAHGTIEAANEMVNNLYKLYDENEQFVVETYKRRDNPARFSDRQIAKSYSQLWQARRHAKHLTLMGEPAGNDLNRKTSMLIREVGKFGSAYRGTPKGQQLVARINQELTRKMPALRKFLGQADRARQQGKLEIVEQQLEAKGLELKSQLVFLTVTEASRYNREFEAMLAKNDGLLESKRKKEYMERATEVMNQQLAAAMEFPAEAQRIRDEIAAGGSATLAEGTTAAAPQAFAHVATLWGSASAGLVRATALVWAFTGRSQTQVQPSPQQLQASAIGALASIIEAAAVATPPDQVQQVYEDLLKEISVVDRRLGSFSEDVRKGCEPALGKLAAKDPALSAKIKSYQRATAEPLRWRRQFAAQHAKTLANGVPTATAMLTRQSEVPSHIRPEFMPPPRPKETVGPSNFNFPANWTVHEASVRLVGKPVIENRMIRLTPSSRTAVIPYQGNHYGNVPAAMQSEQESADLKTAVVVDDTHGPLSFEAADAVSAADMHDYLVVAGPIQQVHLEALVTRFIGLPEVAYMLAPFGRPPTIAENSEPLNQTCWRLDIMPVWAQHKYFTVANQSK